MKKSILLVIILWGGIDSIYSQNEHVNKGDSFNKKDSINEVYMKIEPKSEHVYVIFTSKEYDPENEHGITEGVMRNKSSVPDTIDAELTTYKFLSRSKNFRVEFMHLNFNLEDLKKIRPIKPTDKMSVVMVSKKFLSSIKPIDLDEQGPSMTKEEALALRERLVGKVIWVIDRRGFTRDSVKLIQTETRIPESF